MVLGNHDYMDNPYAQIEFTTHPKNTLNLWYMPDNHYKMSHAGGSTDNHHLADFFFMDTNGCQGHVQRSHPETVNNLQSQLTWLKGELNNSLAQWKFVIGHHPMYNKGRGHGPLANCLREEQYTQHVQPRGRYCMPNEYEEQQCQGFGMENVVSSHAGVIYLSGHEHVFQHHHARGVQHVVCGNSGAEMTPQSPQSHTPFAILLNLLLLAVETVNDSSLPYFLPPCFEFTSILFNTHFHTTPISAVIPFTCLSHWCLQYRCWILPRL